MAWTVWSSSPGRSNVLVSFPNRPDGLWGPLCLLLSGYQGSFSRVKCWNVLLATHLHQAPRLRMSRALLLLPLCLHGIERIALSYWKLKKGCHHVILCFTKVHLNKSYLSFWGLFPYFISEPEKLVLLVLHSHHKFAHFSHSYYYL